MSSLFSFGFTKSSQDGGSAKKPKPDSSSQPSPATSKTKKVARDSKSSSSSSSKAPKQNSRTSSKESSSASASTPPPPPPPPPPVVGKRVNGKTGTKRACLSTPQKSPPKTNTNQDDEAGPECQGEQAVGRRVKLYWKNEKKWYMAEIKSHVHDQTFVVRYKSDGVEEQLDLDRERVEWLPQDSKTSTGTKRKKSSGKNRKSGKSAAKAKKPVKRLRRLAAVISDDDDSDDEEVDASEGSEESAYSEGSASSEDDDDDDDASVVLDDDVSEVGDESDEEEEEKKKPTRRRAAKSPASSSSASSSSGKATVSPVRGRSTPSKPAETARTTTPIRSTSTPIRRTPGKSPMFGNSPFCSTPLSSRKTIGTPGAAATPQVKAGVLSFGEHEHHHLPWLQDDQVKDSDGRKRGNPEYDCTTLHVPAGYLKGEAKYHASNPRKITPGMQAFWGFKAKCADAVIFYKVGKFYELYHMDADVGVEHLGCVYMRGDTAHCGFPEIAYGKYSEKLVNLGFRVARVEQTETPEQMKVRTGKSSGCVRREICAILSPGTRTLSVRDGDNRPLSVGLDADARVQLLAVVEMPLPADAETRAAGDELLIGVTLLDPTTGRFRVGCFNDDANRFSLRTLLSQERPAEVCFVNGALSDNTVAAIKYEVPPNGPLGPTLYTPLAARKSQASVEASADHALSLLTTTYFATNGTMPPALAQMLAHKHLPQVVASLGALGACLEVLRRAYIDHELVTLGDITAYTLPGCSSLQATQDSQDSSSTATAMDTGEVEVVERDLRDAQVMVLDGMALTNLEVFESSSVAGNSKDGSLLAYLDRCVTSFGKRRLRGWLSKPLYSAWAIRQRQDKVASLVALLQYSRLESGGGDKNGDVVSQLRTELKHVPDLERLVSRIHALGMKAPEGHPDARAVVYDVEKQNKVKIEGLVAAIKGLKVLHGALNNFTKALDDADKQQQGDNVLESQHVNRLRALLDSATPRGARLSDVKDRVARLEKSFDMQKSRKCGYVDPTPGCSQDYDDAEQSQGELKELLDQELEKERRELQDMAGLSNSDAKRIVFVDGKVGKDQMCQIHVPTAVHNKDKGVPKHWILLGKAKAHCRYHTRTIKKLIVQLGECNARAEVAKRDVTRLVFYKFDESREHWASVINCAAQLDCLVSLALVSADSSDESPMVRPRIRDPPPPTRLVPTGVGAGADHSGEGHLPMLRLVDSRHPCVAEKMEKSGQGTFIPNDFELGKVSAEAEGEASEDQQVKANNEDGETSTPREGERCLLLTGPNMGGKSTLLRQSCIAVIMAQIGCYVPARECELTPVDRIFTRVGASDRIMQGQSTFFVELSETNTILHKATRNSLAILDELGRGTSTFDGTAIAYAVLKELHDVGCRVMFATHYHSLVQDLRNESGVTLAHMACVADETTDTPMDADDDDDDDDDAAAVNDGPATPVDSRVTFLYKLAPGPSDKSYGLNVARLARLPSEVINKAHVKSEEFEAGLKRASSDHRTTTCEAVLKALSAAAAVSVENDDDIVSRTVMALWEQVNAH